jgi:hypothetical protein
MQYVTTAALARVVNPIVDPPWPERGDVSRQRIKECLDKGKLSKHSYQSMRCRTRGVKSTYHAQRIAYLVRFKDSTPLELDLGIPVLGYYPDSILVDGHHRLAAAIYRKDLWVPVIWGGQDDEFERLFFLTRKTLTRS